MPPTRLCSALLVSLGLLVQACADPPAGQEGEQRPAAERPPAPAPAAAEAPRAAEPARTRSLQAALKAVELVLETGVEEESGLVLFMRFENVTETGFGLATRELSGRDFELADATGGTYSPTHFSPELEEIVPPEGFMPGRRLRGIVRFSVPPGGEPYELRFPDYEPITFSLAQLPSPPVDVRQILGRAELTSPDQDEPKREQTDVQRRKQRVHEVLAVQARAMEEGDLQGYLDTFDRRLHDQERAAFLRLQGLLLTDVGLEAERLGSRETKVRLRYRLHGIPEDNPFFHTLTYRISEGQVVGITDDPRRPVIWRRKFSQHRTNHFLVFADPTLEKDIFSIANEVEGAYADLYREGMPMASGYVVYIMADPKAYAGVAQGSGSLGVALSRYVIQDSRYSVDSRAFYINGAYFLSDERRQFVEYRSTLLTHELVHLALAGITHPATPPWLREGTAMFFSNDLGYEQDRDLVGGGLERFDLRQMTRADSMLHSGREQAVKEYVYAGNVVAYLAQAKGRDHFLDFYAAFADPELRRKAVGDQPAFEFIGLAADRLTATALRRFYGLEVEELDRQVKRWLRIRYP